VNKKKIFLRYNGLHFIEYQVIELYIPCVCRPRVGGNQIGFGVILRISTIFGFGRSFLFLCFCFRVAETSGIYLFYVCGVDIGNLTAKICRGSRCLDTGN